MADNYPKETKRHSDEELLEYLRNNVSGEDANALEKEMLEDAFLEEAMQGLGRYSSVSKITDDVHEINTKLRSQTTRKRKFRRNSGKDLNWILYVAFIVIILILIAFVVMR